MSAVVHPVAFLVSGYPYDELPLSISGYPFDLKIAGATIACAGVIYTWGVNVCSRANGWTIVEVGMPEGVRIIKQTGFDSWEIQSEVTESGLANLKRLAQRAVNRFDCDRAGQLENILKAPAPAAPAMSAADEEALEGVVL